MSERVRERERERGRTERTERGIKRERKQELAGELFLHWWRVSERRFAMASGAKVGNRGTFPFTVLLTETLHEKDVFPALRSQARLGRLIRDDLQLFL